MSREAEIARAGRGLFAAERIERGIKSLRNKIGGVGASVQDTKSA